MTTACRRFRGHALLGRLTGRLALLGLIARSLAGEDDIWMAEASNTIGLVTARGGSQGVPGKNIRELAGKPLIAWTIEAGCASRLIDEVIVSTDDAEIAEIARKCGADVPFMRPADLAGDSTAHVPVVEHAVNWLRENRKAPPRQIMVLQPTSPLRTPDDIDGAVMLARERAADAVVSVCRVDQHPYLMKRLNDDGAIGDLLGAGVPYPRRQILPEVVFPNGAIYLIRCDALIRGMTLFPKRTYPYFMPRERSHQIDTDEDIELIEGILRDKARGVAATPSDR